jgi:hypothetical protein
LVVTRGEGADDCPDAANLAEQVRQLTGASVVDTELLSNGSHETWIQVAIVRNFSGYRAEIQAGGLHHGNRSLEDLGPSCASLADAITVTIAIFLDPYAVGPAPPATPPQIPCPPPLKAIPRRPSRGEPQWQPRLSLDLAGGASFGMLEHTAPLIAGRVGWRATERWSLAVGGAFLFPDSVSSDHGTADLGLSYGYLVGCARALGDARRARFDWCAGPLLGSLYGTGRGFVQTSTKRALWAAVAAGPEVLLPFTSGLAWSLAGLGVLPLARQGFDVESMGERRNVFHSSAVAAQISLGVRGEL